MSGTTGMSMSSVFNLKDALQCVQMLLCIARHILISEKPNMQAPKLNEQPDSSFHEQYCRQLYGTEAANLLAAAFYAQSPA